MCQTLPTSKNICGFFICLYFHREGAFSATSFSFLKTLAVLISPASGVFAVFLGCGYELISFGLYWASLCSFPHIICLSSWGSKETSSQKWICTVVPIYLTEKRRENLALAAFICFPRENAGSNQSSYNTHCLGKQRRKLMLDPLRSWSRT